MKLYWHEDEVGQIFDYFTDEDSTRYASIWTINGTFANVQLASLKVK